MTEHEYETNWISENRILICKEESKEIEAMMLESGIGRKEKILLELKQKTERERKKLGPMGEGKMNPWMRTKVVALPSWVLIILRHSLRVKPEKHELQGSKSKLFKFIL